MEASRVPLREVEGKTRLSRIPCWMTVISDRAVPLGACAPVVQETPAFLALKMGDFPQIHNTALCSLQTLCHWGLGDLGEGSVKSQCGTSPSWRWDKGSMGMCSHLAPAGLSRTPSPRHTGTKQDAKKWCHCVMSNPCIIKILFEQMSQEASGPVSQAGAAKLFWPSVTEPGVSVWLALAGIAVMRWVLRAGLCPSCPQGPPGEAEADEARLAHTGESGAGSCLQEPPSLWHPLQNLL